jgi:GT2 family glycosyltransferase
MHAVTFKISFIVPCLNHLEQTQQMYRSLKETLPLGLKYEVIFVDDASTDGTRAWLAALTEPNIKVIFNSATLGYAKANNKALQLASGQVIGLLNNDLVFESSWLEPMLDTLENPALKAGIVGNIQVRVLDGALDHVGIELNLRAKLEHVRWRQTDTSQSYVKVFALTGACCLIKKDILDRVQGLSEEFLNGCEDVDLCLKIAQLGLHSYVALDSTIRHHVSLTRGVNSLQNETNSSTLQKKWRAVLKREITASWYTSLTKQSTAVFEEYFDGEVLPEMISMPEATSDLVAENMLLRNEYQWARLFQQADVNHDGTIQITCSGLSQEPGSEYLVASEVVRLTVKGVKNVRNFCAYGYRVENARQSQCLIKVTVNNIQSKIFDVTNDRSFILNIEDPLLLQESENHFKLSIEQTPNITEHSTQSIANSPVLFTHFMLDKRFVYISELSTV